MTLRLCALLSAPATITKVFSSSCMTAPDRHRQGAGMLSRRRFPPAPACRRRARSAGRRQSARRLRRPSASTAGRPSQDFARFRLVLARHDDPRRAARSARATRSAIATDATTWSLLGSMTRRMTSRARRPTMSPGLCARLAITPAKRARTTVRDASTRAAFALAALRLTERRLRFGEFAFRVLEFFLRRHAVLEQRRQPRHVGLRVVDARLGLPDLRLAARRRRSTARESRSGRADLQASPDRLPPSGLDDAGGLGAVITQSAPGAAADDAAGGDDALQGSRASSVTVVTGVGAFVSTCSTAAS